MNATERVDALIADFAADDAAVAWLLCDRHPADDIAFTIIDTDDVGSHDLTFGELAADSHRYAHALRELGVGPGDRVATLMGKSAELVTVILATWRVGAVYVPLFTAFAPQAIALRLEGSQARVVIVDPEQRHKLDPGPDMPEHHQRHIVVTRGDADLVLTDLVAAASVEPITAVAVGGSAALVHMFTSGTTGKPKGVVHPVAYIAGWQTYLEYSLGVTGEGNYWCAADPGWAYGLYAAIVAPMAAGVRSILVAGGFNAESTWRTLVKYAITDFTAAPTVYRALRSSPQPIPKGLRLQRASSAGEPLTPEVNEWAATALGIEVRDHFGQTEVGMVLGNHHHRDVATSGKTGSMGRAVPGWELTVLADDRDEPAVANMPGRVAIDVPASPLMTFRDYHPAGGGADKFTADGRWYLTGDVAALDADGDFFFSSRDDDVIIMAGYRIGPFEIESVLCQHQAVAECAVIGAPDPIRREVVEAFVVLRAGVTQSEGLAAALQQLVKTRYAAHAYPRTVHFVDALPKTPSGKVQRNMLRSKRSSESVAAVTS